MKKLRINILLILTVLISGSVFAGKAHAAEIPKQATLYFDNSVTNWSSVYIYIWGSKEHFRPWGDLSLKMAQDGSIFSYTLSLDDRDAYASIIFWNGESQQTENLDYTGEQHIFRADSSRTDGSKKKWSGSWYFNDDGRLLEQKRKFEALNKDWYTPASYELLKSAILPLPSVYDDAYLLVKDGTSRYEADYFNAYGAYRSLEYSPMKLVDKITELEAKNMTGYTYESVLSFRNEVEEVKNYIDESAFSAETLNGNYEKLNQSVKLLVITAENGTNAAVEALKGEIEKLQQLLGSSSSDTEKIVKLCEEIEAAYKELTGRDSNLSGTVKRLIENDADGNSTPETMEQLDKELKKLSNLLNADTIKVDELIAGYEEMENNYMSFANGNGSTEKLLKDLRKEISIEKNKSDSANKYFWVSAVAISLVIIQAAVITLLLFRRRRI